MSVYPDSCKCVASIAKNFTYYDPVELETAQASSFEEKVTSLNGMDDDHYEFVFDSYDNTFLCLASISAHCAFKVVREDGSVLLSTDNVAPINNLATSMWESVEMKINNMPVNTSSSKYIAFKAFNEKLMTSEDLTAYCHEADFFKAENNHDFYGEVTAGNSENASFQHRKKRVALSKECDTYCPVPCDFFRANNHLAPGNRISLVFKKNPQDFILSTDSTSQKYKLIVTKLALYGHRIKLLESLVKNHVSPHKTQAYLAPYSELKPFCVAKQSTQWSRRIINGGVLPKQVVISIVNANAFYGLLTKTPLNYKKITLNLVNLKRDGIRIPNEPFRPDFDTGIMKRDYYSMFPRAGRTDLPGADITEAQFRDGFTIYPISLQPDTCVPSVPAIGRRGTLDLELGWQGGLPGDYMILVHCFYQQMLSINPSNGITSVEIF